MKKAASLAHKSILQMFLCREILYFSMQQKYFINILVSKQIKDMYHRASQHVEKCWYKAISPCVSLNVGNFRSRTLLNTQRLRRFMQIIFFRLRSPVDKLVYILWVRLNHLQLWKPLFAHFSGISQVYKYCI